MVAPRAGRGGPGPGEALRRPCARRQGRAGWPRRGGRADGLRQAAPTTLGSAAAPGEAQRTARPRGGGKRVRHGVPGGNGRLFAAARGNGRSGLRNGAGAWGRRRRATPRMGPSARAATRARSGSTPFDPLAPLPRRAGVRPPGPARTLRPRGAPSPGSRCTTPPVRRSLVDRSASVRRWAGRPSAMNSAHQKFTAAHRQGDACRW